MSLHVIPASSMAPKPWRNGGGLMRELLVWPSQGDWQLRITLAEVRKDGPFSPFPGVQRHFVVVGGCGLSLRWPSEAAWQDLIPGHEPLCFDGAQAPDCRLLPPPRASTAEVSTASASIDGMKPHPAEPLSDHSIDLNLMTQGGLEGRMQAMRVEAGAAAADLSTAQRGFFAAVPGRWWRSGGPASGVAAHTLVWQQRESVPAPLETWHFQPTTPPADGEPCGWWLGASPL